MQTVFRQGAVVCVFCLLERCVYKGNSPFVALQSQGADLWEMMNADMVKLLCNIMKNKFDIFMRYFFMPIL